MPGESRRIRQNDGCAPRRRRARGRSEGADRPRSFSAACRGRSDSRRAAMLCRSLVQRLPLPDREPGSATSPRLSSHVSRVPGRGRCSLLAFRRPWPAGRTAEPPAAPTLPAPVLPRAAALPRGSARRWPSARIRRPSPLDLPGWSRSAIAARTGSPAAVASPAHLPPARATPAKSLDVAPREAHQLRDFPGPGR